MDPLYPFQLHLQESLLAADADAATTAGWPRLAEALERVDIKIERRDVR